MKFKRKSKLPSEACNEQLEVSKMYVQTLKDLHKTEIDSLKTKFTIKIEQLEQLIEEERCKFSNIEEDLNDIIAGFKEDKEELLFNVILYF